MAQRQFRSDDTSKWIYRYGLGKDGVFSTSGNATWTVSKAGCTGVTGEYTINIDDVSSFANGDFVMIHQSRGSSYSFWELNCIVSGAGTATLTLLLPLCNTYTDTTSDKAQVVEMKDYSKVTINTGHTISVSAWDGNSGGIIPFFCNGITTINGILTASGTNGALSKDYLPANTSGGGFLGGKSSHAGSGSDVRGYCGEGLLVPYSQGAANGVGGGGGFVDNEGTGDRYGGPGGGGGNATAGTAGDNVSGANGGDAGGTAGNAGLTLMSFGGGGGGGALRQGDIYTAGAGGSGGGIILIISKMIVFGASGSIKAIGGNGGSAPDYPAHGGGGAGGSILLKTQMPVDLGTGKVLASGGTGGRADGYSGAKAGNGGTGRIHCDCATLISGTTTPTIDARIDKSLGNIHYGGII